MSHATDVLIDKTCAHQPPNDVLFWLVAKLAWLYTNMPFKKSINPSHLTSDPAAINTFHEDPLVRGDVYIKTISGLLLEGYKVLDENYRNWPVGLPVMITHGENDRSTSPAASRKFIDQIKADDKEFKPWPGMLHEGHNERPELRDPFIKHSLQ
jgi:acylglycerol lipase